LLQQNEQMSTTRGATVAAWWPWLALPAVATGLVSAGLALSLTDPDGSWIKGEAWVNVPLAIGFSTVAAGIWSTRPHLVGVRRLAVLYTVVGLGAACVLPAHGWARSDVAGAAFAAWVSSWVWSLGAAPLLGIGLLLYPDGHLPGRRWWPAATMGLTGMVTLAASAALRPGPLEDHPEFSNAVGLGSRDLWEVAGTVGFTLLMLGAALGVAGLVVKFRRAPAGGDVRGQIGGFSLAGALVVVAAVLPEGDDLTATLLGVAAGTALPITTGAAVVRHQLLDQRADVEGLNRRVEDLSTSRRHIVNEREEERVRLRRELHDGLGPSLAAIGLGLRQLEQRTGGGVVRELADEVQRAVSEVRRICDGLRPAALNELGVADALTESIEPLQRFGPRITLTVEDLPTLAPAVEVAAFRIVMEAVTNAVRHADAQHVQVRVGYDDGVTVHVGDDGRGLATDRVPGIGLRGMSDRAEEVGGRLTVKSGSPVGTAVHAWLPAAEHD
jgi:signal transduction histidine kinase